MDKQKRKYKEHTLDEIATMKISNNEKRKIEALAKWYDVSFSKMMRMLAHIAIREHLGMFDLKREIDELEKAVSNTEDLLGA